jgi:hypothetical protein
MMKEHKEFAECPCLGSSGGGTSDHVGGSPSDSIAIDGKRPESGTFGYNTKRGTSNPAAPARERKGGY